MQKEWNTPGGMVPTLYLDILKQPHTLIAGTTGSGKSVALNGIMYTALSRFPNYVEFILIDLKRVELRMYKDLPHTIAYCDTAAAAMEALQYSIGRIDNEYDRMAKNEMKQSDAANLYVIVDELNDLISLRPNAVPYLARIARIGRAANVHIIAATQTPNRRTLSADFAANCPARLGLRCRDSIESRQIIGSSCAVDLPMYGQAYYVAPQYRDPQLFAIRLYSDEELAARVKWWTDQVSPKSLTRRLMALDKRLEFWLGKVSGQSVKL